MVFASKNKSEIDALKICRMVLEALTYLHKNGIIHRDLNPSNIMITSEMDSIKIIDFGLARDSLHKTNEQVPSMTPVGQLNYRSPEMVEDHNYSFGTDVWAIGKILLEIISGRFLSRKKVYL